MRLKEAPCGAVTFDDERTITAVNDEALRYLGHAPEELVGQSLSVLLPPAVRILFHAKVYALLAEGQRVEEVYAMLRCKDGRELPVLLNAVRRERDSQYETDCVFLAVKRRDSFTRHLERLEVSKLQPHALAPTAETNATGAPNHREHAERLSTLGLLLASVMHEINNPLTYVRGNLDLMMLELEQASLPSLSHPTIRECERDMRDGLERIGQLAASICLVSRAPGDVVAPFAVGEVIDLAVRLVSHRIRETALLRLEGPRPGATVLGDGARLAQVLMNLLLNAAQALAAQPSAQNKITVSNTSSGSLALIEVADNGPGIPEALREQVFAPFYTTKPVGEGTGLGLAISRQIVTSLGGNLAVGTSPGGGATFRITLPLFG